MSDKEIIKEQELENVSGGEYRTVNTGDSRDAAIRSYNAPVVATLPNGTAANTTGAFDHADGRTWAEINYPVQGWIKASILGYAW